MTINTESLARQASTLERTQAIAALEAAETALVHIRHAITALEHGPRPRHGLSQAREVEIAVRERRAMACCRAVGVGVPSAEAVAALERGARAALTW